MFICSHAIILCVIAHLMHILITSMMFKYSDGSELTWTNWNPWEPNNIGGYENCAVVANWGWVHKQWFEFLLI